LSQILENSDAHHFTPFVFPGVHMFFHFSREPSAHLNPRFGVEGTGAAKQRRQELREREEKRGLAQGAQGAQGAHGAQGAQGAQGLFPNWSPGDVLW